MKQILFKSIRLKPSENDVTTIKIANKKLHKGLGQELTAMISQGTVITN